MSKIVSEIRIARGFAPLERARAAALYWEAFGAKLSVGLGPDAKAQVFLERVMNPDYALCARDKDGALLGLAGYKTEAGALVGGAFGDIRAVYGMFGATWRALLLSLLERAVQKDVLLMDGIFVTADARGKGVGSALLLAIKEEAACQGCAEVRLDVIDTNPRARALYERAGFKAEQTETIGPLRHIFGFSSATQMRYTLRAQRK